MKMSKTDLPVSLLLTLNLILFGCLVDGYMVTFHITNKCSYPIWPAIAPNTGHAVIADGGFLLHNDHTKQVQVPATWNGRFWGRTGCNFTSNSKSACQTGDCDGMESCNGIIGLPPATLVEVSLREGMRSVYDVSVVDGYNLPISVTPKPSNSNCLIKGCTKNINNVCPEKLRVSDQSGNVIACKSACLAFKQDKFCCRNSYAVPEKCNANMYSKIFKEACPSYISYAYDTTPALGDCNAKDYAITFCPSHKWSGPQINWYEKYLRSTDWAFKSQVESQNN